MSDITVRGPEVDRSDEILTPEALDFVADLQRRFGSRRDDLLAERRERRGALAAGGTLDFLAETASVRAGDWQVAPVPHDLRDRRVEITGPTERKMAINALNSGAQVWLADLEDANTPHWVNVVGRSGHPVRRGTAHHRVHLAPGQGVRPARARRDPGDPAPAARLAPRRGAPPGRRAARRRGSGRLRPLLLPQRPRAARARHRAVLLPAEAGVPPRGPVVGRRLHPRTGSARAAARDHPGDGADRDDHGRLRDGGDPLVPAGPRRRPQRRPLGLPVQHHQELPRRRSGRHPPRPQRRHHDRTDDDGVQRPARRDLPPARRVRHRRDGRVHPEPLGRRGQRAGLRQGA